MCKKLQVTTIFSGYNKPPSIAVSVPFGLNDMQITKLLDAETNLKYEGLKLQEAQIQNAPQTSVPEIICLLENFITIMRVQSIILSKAYMF
jgi:hypothetical protein